MPNKSNLNLKGEKDQSNLQNFKVDELNRQLQSKDLIIQMIKKTIFPALKSRIEYLEEQLESGISSEKKIVKDISSKEEQVNQKTIMDSTEIKKTEVIKDSEFKDIPKGFKEIQASEEFTIITPHDENFVKKQRAITEESDYLKSLKQSPSEQDAEPTDRIDFEQPKDGKSLICFACGHDKNAPNAKVCKNCGTKLN